MGRDTESIHRLIERELLEKNKVLFKRLDALILKLKKTRLGK